MPLLESARRHAEKIVLEAPEKLEVKDSDFAEKIIVSGPLIGQIGDAASTIIGLRNGLVEANPFMKKAVKNIPLFALGKLAYGVGMGILVKKIENPTTKKIVSGLATLTGVAPTVNNIIQLGKK